MPIIDNQKMACEPCIRGHRSTKCNHANERMMIPVRKPGRPLSICPHPPNNRCSCTSVTAALPRTRRCGGCVSKPGASSGSASGSGPASSAKAVPRSPSKRPFSSKSLQLSNSQPPLGQGQFNASILGRPEMGIPVNAAPSWPNGSASPAYGGMPMQQHQDYIMSMQSAEYMSGPGMIPMHGGPFQHEFQISGQANGSQMYAHDQFQPPFPAYSNGLDMSAFGPSLDDFATGPAAHPMNGFDGIPFPAQVLPPPQLQQTRGSCCGSSPTPATESITAPATAADKAPSSCCAPPPPPPKRSESSCCGPAPSAVLPRDASSTESAQITPVSSRNSLASNPGTTSSDSPTSLSSSFSQHAMLKTESRAGGPLSSIPQAPQSAASTASTAQQRAAQDQTYANIVAQHRLQQHGTPAWYRYAPQFGTASTPLQQSQWRSSLIVTDGHANTSATVEGGLQRAGFEGAPETTTAAAVTAAATANPAYTFVPAPTTADSDGNSHLCSCGDDCNCVGCVAHPYNAATQNAVQAAWQAIDDLGSTSSGARTARTHVSASPNGITTFQLANTGSETSSPVQEFTPSDTADDQPLSADDFLFVNYSVAGCIGEDLVCPCGDDCQCFGCTLHNPPV